MLYSNLPKPQPRRYSIPNEIMILHLSIGALAVYNYLLYVEDRKTYQCHPSYTTIGEALSIKSKGTVKKYVEELEEKCLIYTEPTTIFRKGKKVNGNLLYTIRPIQDALEHFYHLQMQENALAMQKEKVAELLKESGQTPIPAA